MTQEKITSLFFEGQQWAPRNDGGIYQAVRVWANGRLLGCVGMSYGYGSMYAYTAQEFLAEIGLMTEDDAKGAPWRLQDKGITLYSSLSEVAKRELVKPQAIAENIARFATI